MKRVITCPYCGGHMECRELGFKAKYVFYECEKCLSRSPLTTNKVTANSMAQMRRTEPNQPVRDVG